MAKVVAPLQSFSASGKIGKSLVFFSHLGRNVVRGLVTPANPMTAGQGAVRLLMGALGRAAKVPYVGGPFLTALKTVIPAGQTWVSAMVSFGMQLYGDAAGLASAYEGHAKDTVFQAQGALLGLTPVTVSYAGATTTLTAGAQLYALAAYANAINQQNPDIFGASAPWDEVLASWTTTDIVAFVGDITATT